MVEIKKVKLKKESTIQPFDIDQNEICKLYLKCFYTVCDMGNKTYKMYDNEKISSYIENVDEIAMMLFNYYTKTKSDTGTLKEILKY